MLGARTPMHFISAYLSVSNNYSKTFRSCRSENSSDNDSNDNNNDDLDGSNSSASSDVHATVYNDTLKNKIEKKMVELAHIVCLEASLKPIHASKGVFSLHSRIYSCIHTYIHTREYS